MNKHVRNQLEHVPDQFTKSWKWRVAEKGKSNNGISEGENGPREMSNYEMASSTFLPKFCSTKSHANRLPPGRDFKFKQVRL